MRWTYTLEEAFVNLRHGKLVNLLCLIIIALTIMILSALVLLALHIHAELRRLQDEPAIVVFLEDSVDDSSAHQLRSQLEKIRGVKGVRYISKQAALERARDIFGEDAEAVLSGFEDTNPFPASFEIETQTSDLKQIEQIAGEIATYPGIEQVEYERTSTIFVRRAQFVLMGLGTLLASASIIIVWFSILLTVYFRREELYIMQLVGATYWYIRTPLLITGALLGLGGSGFGLLAFYGLFRLIMPQLGAVSFLPPPWIGLILGFGCVVGLLGGAVPIRRHIQR